MKTPAQAALELRWASPGQWTLKPLWSVSFHSAQFVYISLRCVHTGVGVPRHSCGGQRTAHWRLFFPFGFRRTYPIFRITDKWLYLLRHLCLQEQKTLQEWRHSVSFCFVLTKAASIDLVTKYFVFLSVAFTLLLLVKTLCWKQRNKQSVREEAPHILDILLKI